MNWLLIAFISPALLAVSNHIDKYLLTKYCKTDGPGALVIVSALVGIIFLPFIFLLRGSELLNIDFTNAALIMTSGVLLIISLVPYMYAMKKDETSTVTVIFQSIPVFAYILGLIFFKEALTIKQILASLLILGGATGVAADFDGPKFRIKTNILLLMILASIILAFNSFIFKFVAIQTDFWVTVFWNYVGYAIAFVLFSLVPSYRKQFFALFKSNKFETVALNITNELLNSIALLVMGFATLLAPLALVLVINGVQPFFAFVLGIILTLFFPRFGKENLEKKHIIHKIIFIAIVFFGIYLLYMG